MSLLGGIRVAIGADIRGLESGMKRAGVIVNRGARHIRENAAQYAKWGAAASAAAAAAAAAIYRSTSQQIDQLAKTSDRLGIATEDLQALQFAAEQTGVETRTLEMGLQRMTRRVSEAAQGSGEAKDAIAELGLSAEYLNRLSPDEKFREIAGAMEQVAGQGDRVRLAMRLFDSEGVALVNTLEGGTEALDAFAKQAEELGLSISRVDAAQVEAANDAINRASTLIEGQLQQAVVGLAPYVTALADEFIKTGKGADNMSGVAVNALERIAKGFAYFGDSMRGIELIIKTLETGFKGFGFAVSKVLLSVREGVTKAVRKSIEGVNMLINAYNKLPGVDDIDLLNTDWGAEALQRSKQIVDEARQSFADANFELVTLANTPLPTDNVDAFFANLREQAAKTRQEMNVSGAVDEMLGGGLFGFGGGEDKEGGGKYTPEENEQFLEGLRERFATEAELVNQKLEADLERLKKFSDKELEILGGREAAKTKLEKDAAAAREKIQEQEMQAKLGVASSMFSNLSSLMNTESKKMFEIGKAAAIAGAIVDGIAATMGAYKVGNKIGGPWLGAAYAATAAAGSAVKIQQIKSQQFGQTGSTTTFDNGLPATRTTGSNQQQQPEGDSGRSVNINLVGGDRFSRSDIRSLIGQINDEIGDGVTLATSG